MADIKLDPKNYRVHGEKNKAIIRKSLEDCGAGRSILLDGDDVVIAGNGVYEQAQALGLPVRVIESDGRELIAIKRTDLKTEDDKRRALALLPRFIIGVLGIVDYPVRGITSFRYKGRRYYLPKSGTDISGELTPLSGVTAIEFCQLSDIVCAENIALAPLAVAIVCRRKSERYDEELAQNRAALFGSLPASVYWELWAQTSGAHQYLKAAFPNCYGTGGGDSSGKAEPAVWCDTLVAMSTDKPSELEHLQRMNAYDFVHLLSENIKRRTEEWKMKAALAACGVR